MIEVSKWRHFTKVDWYGFAGCELFPNGEQPIWISFSGGEILADVNGLCLFPDNDEGEIWWSRELHLPSAEHAVNFVKGLHVPWVRLGSWVLGGQINPEEALIRELEITIKSIRERYERKRRA